VLKERKTETERTGLVSLANRGEAVALLRATDVAILFWTREKLLVLAWGLRWCSNLEGWVGLII
jgi:hypothetical protein